MSEKAIFLTLIREVRSPQCLSRGGSIMLTLQERALLVSVQDRLLELYVLREQANKHGHREHLYWIEADIAQVEAQREEIRQWEMPRLHSPGDTLMAKGLANMQRRHIREKSVIDHAARELFK